MSNEFFIFEHEENDFNKILNNVNDEGKNIIQVLEKKFSILDTEKKKNRLKGIAFIYSVCLTFLEKLDFKETSKEDVDFIKSLFDEKENNQISNLLNILTQNQNLINNDNNNIIPNNIENNQNIDSNIIENGNPNNFENINEIILAEPDLLKLDLKKQELKSQKNLKIEEPNMATCNICLEEYDQNDITNPELDCKNHFHGKCLIDYVESELNNNHFPIRCPVCLDDKRHEVNYKIILDILLINDKDNLAQKLEAKSLNYLAENNPEDVSFCPTPGCNYMCSFDRNEFHLDCPLCKKSYCLKCKTEWHKGMTCEEYQRTKNKDENDVKFEEFVRGNNYKQCPNCKRWVEKISGCNFIACPCGSNFCYNCGKLYDKNNISHVCRYCNNLWGNGRNGLFPFPQMQPPYLNPYPPYIHNPRPPHFPFNPPGRINYPFPYQNPLNPQPYVRNPFPQNIAYNPPHLFNNPFVHNNPNNRFMINNNQFNLGKNNKKK